LSSDPIKSLQKNKFKLEKEMPRVFLGEKKCRKHSLHAVFLQYSYRSSGKLLQNFKMNGGMGSEVACHGKLSGFESRHIDIPQKSQMGDIIKEDANTL
jgi:hypothetical protein